MTVGGGIAAAQLISLAFIPLLTRLYGPTAFGVLGTYTAVVSIIMPLATLCYANAIVLPEHDHEVEALIKLARRISWAGAFLALILVLAAGPILAGLMNLDANPEILLLLPLSFIFSGMLSTAVQLAIRNGQFGARSRAHIESTIVSNLARAVGGVFWPTGLALIGVFAITPGLGAMFLRWRTGRYKRESTSVEQIRLVACRYRDFPCYRTPQAVLNAASLGLPVLLLANLFGSASAGQYSLAVLVLSAPVMLLGQSVGEVFYPSIVKTARENPKMMSIELRKATVALMLVGVIVLAPVLLFGPVLFSFAFGDEWMRAGNYAQWLAVWLLTVLMNRPAVAAIPVLAMQGTLLIYEVALTVLRVLALAVSATFFNEDLIAVASFACVGAAANLLLISLVNMKARDAV